MSTFDESKIRRDGEGKFATKGPAAEAAGVHLGDVVTGEVIDDDDDMVIPGEVADPVIVTGEVISETRTPPAPQVVATGEALRESNASLRERRAQLRAELDEVEAEVARGDLAEFAADNPRARYVELAEDDPSAKHLHQWPGNVYDDRGRPLGSPSLQGGRPLSSAPTRTDAFAQFRTSGNPSTLDLNRVRVWAQTGSVDQGSLEAQEKYRQFEDGQRQRESLRQMGETARSALGNDVASVRFDRWDGRMEYQSSLDRYGRELHRRGARLPGGGTDTDFRERMNQSVASLSVDDGDQAWMESADVSRFASTSSFQSATIHLDRSADKE